MCSTRRSARERALEADVADEPLSTPGTRRGTTALPSTSPSCTTSHANVGAGPTSGVATQNGAHESPSHTAPSTALVPRSPGGIAPPSTSASATAAASFWFGGGCSSTHPQTHERSRHDAHSRMLCMGITLEKRRLLGTKYGASSGSHRSEFTGLTSERRVADVRSTDTADAGRRVALVGRAAVAEDLHACRAGAARAVPRPALDWTRARSTHGRLAPADAVSSLRPAAVEVPWRLIRAWWQPVVAPISCAREG